MNANLLLLWLSAKGSATWPRFKAALDDLKVSDTSNEGCEDLDGKLPDSNGFPVHHRLRLNLQELGHVEFFRPDFPNGWRIVPPTLVSVSNKRQTVGIFCGARTDHLLGRLFEFSSN